jgi:hypothetical protein
VISLLHLLVNAQKQVPFPPDKGALKLTAQCTTNGYVPLMCVSELENTPSYAGIVPNPSVPSPFDSLAGVLILRSKRNMKRSIGDLRSIIPRSTWNQEARAYHSPTHRKRTTSFTTFPNETGILSQRLHSPRTAMQLRGNKAHRRVRAKIMHLQYYPAAHCYPTCRTL